MTDALSAWYRGRRVLVTGHTGFKGSWLVAWLRQAGAIVTGYALAPESGGPALFRDARLAEGITSHLGDIRDAAALEAATLSAAPELVFHLAAQSLVRRSYREPLETFATNVMGTAHVLEAVRQTPEVRAVVVVTSDKCYENDGSGKPLHEDAPMGGHDPYSASKGCTELVTTAWRRSFLAERGIAVASARAGNVFGGGDWAEDRLIPDLARAAGRDEVATIRHPLAVRPWQYVLEPLHGYLLLGRALIEQGDAVAEGWNFGPSASDALTVREIAARLASVWPRVRVREAPDAAAVHEAPTLTLDASKAAHRLGWHPLLTLDAALERTAAWYRDALAAPDDIPALVERHLGAFTDAISSSAPAAAGARSS
ncbi:MAG: CDP-glucose 4,6-dehydratase [Gemmatimonadota bacterium]